MDYLKRDVTEDEAKSWNYATRQVQTIVTQQTGHDEGETGNKSNGKTIEREETY